jgi:3-oxoacyl-[acyl-carrier protein] reductase
VAGDVAVTADADRLVDAAVAVRSPRHPRQQCRDHRDGLLLRMKDEDWDAVLNVNLGGFSLHPCRSQGMTKQRYGRIINISSLSKWECRTGQLLRQQNRPAGPDQVGDRELARRNVTVNAVTRVSSSPT